MEKDEDRGGKEDFKTGNKEETMCEKAATTGKDNQTDYPVKVPKCPSNFVSSVCKLTRELCEYGNKPQKCLDYYQKTDMAIYEDLSIVLSKRAQNRATRQEKG